jgi:hypothetical protein
MNATELTSPARARTRLRLASIAGILIVFTSTVQATQALNTDHPDQVPVAAQVVNDILHLSDPTYPRSQVLQRLNPFAQTAPTPTGAWLSLPEQAGQTPNYLFRQNSRSLVAKAVGSAEGTRRPDGGTNQAYYGHVDPGNAVWNVGTFSYQHCGKCAPEEADRRQLNRLARQFERIQTYAQRQYGMRLNLEEQLNAIDLANQAPLAALASGGFVDRLQQAKANGMKGSDAILQARVYSYKNPVTNMWEAPGLGNTLARITHDQARRQEAIARAIQLHQ